MKTMRKLEIEIPDNKEIDWEASAKQKQIVLKNKPFTYEDVCTQIFASGCWYLDSSGNISYTKHPSDAKNDPNNATTQHQLECILAKNKLANVARYLNSDWKWKLGSNDAFYIMEKSIRENEIDLVIVNYSFFYERHNILFKSKEAAQQAVEILGKETIKLALEPLY